MGRSTVKKCNIKLKDDAKDIIMSIIVYRINKCNDSINDSGFLYGDGLFETYFDDRRIFSTEKHLRRLTKGLDIISLKLNKSINDLSDLLNQVIEKNNSILV